MTNFLDSIDEAQSILDTMTNDEFKNDLMGLMKSRFPLVYLTTNEERRMLHFFRCYCRVNRYKGYVWDSFRGLVSLDTGEAESSSDELKNPPIMLEHILNKAHEIKQPAVLKRMKDQEGISGIVFLLLDFHRYLDNATVIIERRVKEIAHMESVITTIMTGPHYVSTAATDNLFSLLDFPYPNSIEIKESLWAVVRTVSKKLPKLKAETQKMEEDLVKSVQGLTIIEAQSAYAKSLVIHKKWDMPTILNEKKQIIKKSGLLEFHDPIVTIDDVGGLQNLVTWLKRRKHCFSQEAADYGLAIPKGVLCIGVPGCGKSLICKAVANLWGMPLLRLDFGRLFGSLVGQSEQAARDVIRLAEALSPCILWCDEIDKAIGGVAGSDKSDGGTTKRVISTFLTWMQEKTKPVFVVATANDHESIPPEFQRAGRFDEVFFVDLPSLSERKDIFAALLKKRKYNPEDYDLDYLASQVDNYSGAEIEKCIDDAMLIGFEDGSRPITDNDMVVASKAFKPLFEMREDEIADMREWASNRCVRANATEETKESFDVVGGTKKDLDI